MNKTREALLARIGTALVRTLEGRTAASAQLAARLRDLAERTNPAAGVRIDAALSTRRRDPLSGGVAGSPEANRWTEKTEERLQTRLAARCAQSSDMRSSRPAIPTHLRAELDRAPDARAAAAAELTAGLAASQAGRRRVRMAEPPRRGRVPGSEKFSPVAGPERGVTEH